MDGLERGGVKSLQPEEKTQASGNLPEGSLFFLGTLGRGVVKLDTQLSLNPTPTMNKFFM